jgi:hypothetical protein
MLATPYALAASGLAALALLPLLGAAACYTGNLIAACLAAAPGVATTYPDIGQMALGRPGRLLVSVGDGPLPPAPWPLPAAPCPLVPACRPLAPACNPCPLPPAPCPLLPDP